MTNPLAQPPLGPRRVERVERIEDRAAGSGLFARPLSEIQEALLRIDARRWLWGANRILPAFTFSRLRGRLLSAVGCDVRRGVGVLGHIHLSGPPGSTRNLRIGGGSIIGPDAAFCLDGPITLGNNVSIGPRVMLYTATHLIGGATRRMQFNTEARPIVIEEGAWIGLAAIILAGVRIGRGSIVAAGSVVTKDVPDNVLVAGNPAAVVEQLP